MSEESEDADLAAEPPFERAGDDGAVFMSLGVVETRILRRLFGGMLLLLGPDEREPEDPLLASLGIGTRTEAPDDPALARLFPDGYLDDPEAAGEFRRYTEPSLREAKRLAATTALDTLGEPDQKLLLSAEEADAWLRALNDMRLVLGERLGVTEDLEELIESLDEDDPRLRSLWVYDMLSQLQETLVHALW